MKWPKFSYLAENGQFRKLPQNVSFGEKYSNGYCQSFELDKMAMWEIIKISPK